MKKSIIVRWSFEGFHHYDNAPSQVSFLQFVHRHVFYCEAKIEVFHDDRELEFIIVKRHLSSKFSGGYLGQKSCEMIAAEIISEIKKQYGGSRKVSVKVFEDNENGCEIDE